MAFTLTGNEIIFINPLQANGQPGATLQQTSVQNVASVPPIFGSGTGTFQNQGNIYRLFTAGTSPASTAADVVVANSFLLDVFEEISSLIVVQKSLVIITF